MKEITDNKIVFDGKFDKIKTALGALEQHQFEHHHSLLLKLFIHELNFIKNVEYDLSNVITVG